MSALTLITILGLGLGTLVLFLAVTALWRRHPMRATFRLLWAVTFLAVGIAAGATAAGIQGYRAFTHEEVAATVRTEPVGPKRFRATFQFADGDETSYVLAGDQLYIDARILKWKPIVNFLGLHTAYELDRVGGRYYELGEERVSPRTVFPLGEERPVNLFELRQRYTLLAPLLDADYGSATFIEVNGPAQFEVRVSTSGLLVRRTSASQ
jgi:hypothetical protein